MINERKDPALKMPTPAETGGSQHETALKQLLIDGVKDIYWAEQELLKVLPEMQHAATTTGLKQAFAEHITQTEDHLDRLKEIFELCGEEPQTKPCEAMQGLINEGKNILKQTAAGTMTRDAAIIFASQKIEHYEIATYGGLLEFARTLGYREVAGYLNATLDEEKQADQGLSLIAQTGINWNAEHEKELSSK